MSSPRYAPAGLLIEFGHHRVMIDGGPGAAPSGKLDAWLVTDAWAELMGQIRTLARQKGLEPRVASYHVGALRIEPRPVIHTSHPTYGYLLDLAGHRVVWAPEFFVFPAWARGAYLMFAEAASYNRPIRFARGVGGHACVLDVARQALRNHIGALVFAHIGRPTLRAMASEQPPFGTFGEDGDVFRLTTSASASGKPTLQVSMPSKTQPSPDIGIGPQAARSRALARHVARTPRRSAFRT